LMKASWNPDKKCRWMACASHSSATVSRSKAVNESMLMSLTTWISSASPTRVSGDKWDFVAHVQQADR
jgi:hypothetical protein